MNRIVEQKTGKKRKRVQNKDENHPKRRFVSHKELSLSEKVGIAQNALDEFRNSVKEKDEKNFALDGINDDIEVMKSIRLDVRSKIEDLTETIRHNLKILLNISEDGKFKNFRGKWITHDDDHMNNKEVLNIIEKVEKFVKDNEFKI